MTILKITQFGLRGSILKLLSVFLLFATFVQGSESKDIDDSLDALIQKANQVLQKDNVAAAKQAHIVFAAAERLFNEGKNADSEHYYLKGLQLTPWDMKHQLAYAKVLMSLGNEDKARSVARMVLQTSERQENIEESSHLLGEEMPRFVNPMPESFKENKVICFVKIGPVEDWVIQESGKQLSDKLGIPVFTHNKGLPLPKSHRSSYERWSKSLKEDIAWEHPFVKKQMRDIGLKNKELATTDQTLELLARLYVAQGQGDPREQFSKMKKQMQERDEQWDAARLLEVLVREFPANGRVVFVGVLSKDIYSDDSNYVFGSALVGMNYCVHSYCRCTARFNSERENQKRLLERIHKQLLSSVGISLGLERPTDPRSARSYPNSLADHDAKGTWLSPECIAGFEKALGHPLPEKTKEESIKGMNSNP